MTARASQLRAIADGQLDELIDVISAADDTALRGPCVGWEKLADGSVGALATHTVENYQRIATFVATADRASAGLATGGHTGRQVPRILRALGHRAPEHGEPAERAPRHGDQYTADNADLADMVESLTAARQRLGRIGELSDGQLESVPPRNSFRFCDGQRTLEQVLAGLFKHQAHQVETLKAALASAS
jgi:hypothetical protein